LQAAKPRVDWLDALRGWAVLAVICVHSGQAAHLQGLASRLASTGQYGVQLFFVISALTIGLTYESHIRHFGRNLPSQLGWLLKRFFRIAPLYYFAALLYPAERYVIYLKSDHRYGQVTNVSDIVLNLAFLHEWVPSANNSVVPGGWSIGVEMFFYSIVPLIWMLKPARLRLSVLGIACVAGVAVTFIVARTITSGWYVENNSFLYYWFPTQAPVILMGLILYLTTPGLWHHREDSPRMIYMAGSLACFVLALAFGTIGEIAPVLAPATVALGFLGVILSLRGSLLRFVTNRFAMALGKVSYSVYISHFLVLDCERGLLQHGTIDRLGSFAFPVVLVLTILLASGLACLGKRFIEDPGIRLGYLLSDFLVTPDAKGQLPQAGE
jgi:peptidoglycan/LPS O-acetylase OafA/YrhL